MLNQVTLVGRITADPELKEGLNGRPFCFITLATTRAFKNQETNEYETDFIDVSLWGITAENVAKHCGKGSAVAVRARLANRVVDFPGEQTFRTIGVVGERISFISLKAPSSNLATAKPTVSAPTPDASTTAVSAPATFPETEVATETEAPPEEEDVAEPEINKPTSPFLGNFPESNVEIGQPERS